LTAHEENAKSPISSYFDAVHRATTVLFQPV
jgi:hypothetical protein